MLRKTLVFLAAFLLLTTASALAGSYNFITPEEFKARLEKNTPLLIVDIQVAEEFATHHFEGSIETNAFPVETEEQRRMIDPAVVAYKEKGHDVVVVCPRGGGGAKRCYDYLKEQGVPENQLTILKGGIAKWPYKEMLAGK
ncbi:MAG: rhodanese-like domain-containing protein [Thermodesulfobacteriota bacterium]